MLKFTIPEDHQSVLAYERHHHPHPRVMKKMEVLYLKSLNISDDLICKITGICSNTMRTYYKEYMKGGIEKLREVNFYQGNRIKIYNSL